MFICALIYFNGSLAFIFFIIDITSYVICYFLSVLIDRKNNKLLLFPTHLFYSRQ